MIPWSITKDIQRSQLEINMIWLAHGCWHGSASSRLGNCFCLRLVTVQPDGVLQHQSRQLLTCVPLPRSSDKGRETYINTHTQTWSQLIAVIIKIWSSNSMDTLAGKYWNGNCDLSEICRDLKHRGTLLPRALRFEPGWPVRWRAACLPKIWQDILYPSISYYILLAYQIREFSIIWASGITDYTTSCRPHEAQANGKINQRVNFALCLRHASDISFVRSFFPLVELEFKGSKFQVLLPDAVAQVDTGQIHSICARNLWGPSRKMSWLLAPGFAELWAMPALQSGHWLVACSQSMPRQGRRWSKRRCVEILMTGTTFIDFPLCDLRISRWLPMLPPRFSPRMTRIMEPMERLGIKRNLVLFQELPRLWLIFSALMWLTERHDKTEARGSVAGLMWQCAQMRGDVESTWKVDDLTMAQRYGTMFSAMPIAWLRWTSYCHTSDSCKFVRFCHMRSNLFKPCRVLLCCRLLSLEWNRQWGHTPWFTSQALTRWRPDDFVRRTLSECWKSDGNQVTIPWLTTTSQPSVYFSLPYYLRLGLASYFRPA